jgi:hypothetical protein
MTSAQIHPSVLLLDDGELDSVQRMLEYLGADVRRLRGKEIGLQVPCPRDLIVASVQRCLDMPELEPGFDLKSGVEFSPNWVCVHSQDFLPLRDRLRFLGVHFLVHSSLDTESLRLFLLQMLYAGPERRSRVRLPLGTEAFLIAEGNRKSVRLAELSAESCRIITETPVAELEALQLVLCESVGGGEELSLEGVAIRRTTGRSTSGEPLYSTVVSLEALDPETQVKLERIVSGSQIGTPVSPLASRDGDDAPLFVEPTLELASKPPPEIYEQPDRRESPRYEYDRKVELIELCHSSTDGGALGRDLSLTGIRVVGYPEIAVGCKLTLALYGGAREEPIVVRSEVVRGGDPDEVSFRFGSLSESQQRAIEKLLAGRPPLASVDSGQPWVVTKILD